MTMNVRVKRYVAPDDVGKSIEAALTGSDAIYTGSIRANGFTDPRDGFLIECEMFHPKSVKGRTVLLRLTEKDRDDLMLALRREAIRARGDSA